MKSNINAQNVAPVYKKLTSSSIQRFLKRKITGIYTFEDFWKNYLGFASEEEFMSAFGLLKLQNPENILKDLKDSKPPKGKKSTTKVKSVPVETAENVEEKVSTSTEYGVEATATTDIDTVVEEIQNDANTNPIMSEEEKLKSEIANLDGQIEEIEGNVCAIENIITSNQITILSIAEEAQQIRERLINLSKRNEEAEKEIQRFEAEKSKLSESLHELETKRETLKEELQKVSQLRILFSLEREETLRDDKSCEILLADDIEKTYGIVEENRYQQIPRLITVDESILHKSAILKKVANILCLKQIMDNREIIIVLESMDEYLLDLFGKLGIKCDVL